MREILREIVDTIRAERPRLRLDLIMICTGLCAVGPIAFFQRKGMVIAVSLIALGFIVMPGRVARLRRAWGGMTGVLCLALVLWALFSLAWGPEPAGLVWLQVAAMILLGLVAVVGFDDLSPAYRALMVLCFSSTMTCLVAALVFELATGGALTVFVRGPIFSLPLTMARGTVLILLLCWAWALSLRVLWGSWWPAALALILSATAIYGLNMRGAHGGFTVALIFAVLVATRPNPALRLLTVAIVLYALAAPWLSLDLLTIARVDATGIQLPSSWWHRIGVWSIAAEYITKAPLFGNGFHAAHWISDQGMSFTVPAFGNSPFPAMPLHTHNGFIQIWLELGLLGVAISLTILWPLARWLRSCAGNKWIAAAGASSLGGALVIGLVSFGVWQRWWIASLFLAAAMFRLSAGFLRDRA